MVVMLVKLKVVSLDGLLVGKLVEKKVHKLDPGMVEMWVLQLVA